MWRCPTTWARHGGTGMVTRAALVAGVLLSVNLFVSASADEAAAAAGRNAFALELYGRLKGLGGNVACSPHSISEAMAMTYAGARGTTREQIARVFRFANGDDALHRGFRQAREVLVRGDRRRCHFPGREPALGPERGRSPSAVPGDSVRILRGRFRHRGFRRQPGRCGGGGERLGRGAYGRPGQGDSGDSTTSRPGRDWCSAPRSPFRDTGTNPSTRARRASSRSAFPKAKRSRCQ